MLSGHFAVSVAIQRKMHEQLEPSNWADKKAIWGECCTHMCGPTAPKFTYYKDKHLAPKLGFPQQTKDRWDRTIVPKARLQRLLSEESSAEICCKKAREADTLGDCSAACVVQASHGP